MYSILAQHYDSLVKDDEATKRYVQFVKEHVNGISLMELACGSGEISLQLAQTGFQLSASDLSEEMIEVAKLKDTNHLIDYACMDMRSINDPDVYDAILCFCDSMNYIQTSELEPLFKDVYEHLANQGTFLFDMHSKDRIEEFEEGFYEAGIVDGVEYIWSIQSEENSLYHNFVFYDENGNPNYEHHTQYVFDVDKVKDTLKQIGFDVLIYTDFDLIGIQPGEKYFFVCRKDTQ